MKNLLLKINIWEYQKSFKEEAITIETLLSLNNEAFLSLTKEIGIISFGHRQNLKVAIEELRSKSNFERDVDEQVPSQNPKMEDNCENNN